MYILGCVVTEDLCGKRGTQAFHLGSLSLPHTLLSTSILTRLLDMILVFRGRQVWLVGGALGGACCASGVVGGSRPGDVAAVAERVLLW